MEKKEKMEWLGRYREAMQQEDTLLEELKWLRADAERVSAGLATAGGGGAPSIDRLPRAVERIDAARADLEAQVEHCMAVRAQIVRALASVRTPAPRDALYRRYVLGQTTEQIAQALHLVPRRVRQLYDKGLQEINLSESC
ncbi:MAG: hypothetical protein DBX59_01475 [Bacillota bacterium]|nr:MAG: hypothetical protein DBX59_01475 [Bacillota bacterium]